MSASLPSVTLPTPPPAFSRPTTALSASSTTIPASASTSDPPCFPGWLTAPLRPTRPSSTPIAKASDRFSGHGSAIAQVYNHMIMPLANRRDKQTQVVWGIRDFEYRFDRDPEGMWLAETAVDIETLEVLAANGIKFTVLAPSQAKAERRETTSKFKNVEGGKIDPTRPYICNLPSGRSISLFFYDGPISRAVAFEGLLSDGERFANRLHQRIHRKPPLEAAHAHRHRRRNLRSSSSQRGDGPLLRAAPHRNQETRAAHQLRRVPHHQPAHPRSRDHREHRLELLPRRWPLEHRLRLQFRQQARLEPGLARSVAQRPRLPARQPHRTL